MDPLSRGGFKNPLGGGVELCCKEEASDSWFLEWKVSRFYRLEHRANNGGRFFLCTVRDGEGKRHKIFFLKEGVL